MEKSPSIANLAKALNCFQRTMGKVSKDANNPFFKSKYASLGNILEAIQEPLTDCGLCFSQFPSDSHGLTTILIHAESGEFLQSTYFMKPVKDDPQGIGSSITYQRRYALSSVLGLNIDDDDDGNAASTKKVESSKVKTLSINDLTAIQDALKLLNDMEEVTKYFKSLPNDTKLDKGALELFAQKRSQIEKLQKV